MKTITMPEDVFNREFEVLLDTLKLERFVESNVIRSGSEGENSPIGQLHRRFHYEISKFKHRLEDAK